MAHDDNCSCDEYAIVQNLFCTLSYKRFDNAFAMQQACNACCRMCRSEWPFRPRRYLTDDILIDRDGPAHPCGRLRTIFAWPTAVIEGPGRDMTRRIVCRSTPGTSFDSVIS